ncbi:3'-5' exonuclease [Schleiferilactobacillus harbinensis]|uniref:Exonuclease domain-containing protein n=1 Tax=Schleiferilactobacillus harbinensis TaxID=304207 RepID=A0A5P8M5B6_9LACO|nr:exonuclease domain-containing protein [Schleiferilactobacillus harbinensis]QFR23673.1 hypothetical protein D1010_09785 [Schleiferilactobacillus harbinensis]
MVKEGLRLNTAARNIWLGQSHDASGTIGSNRCPIIHKLQKKLYDFVAFDIETTGLSPHRNEIIQLSAIKVKKDEVVDQFDSYVHPSEFIPTNIVYLTGISRECLKIPKSCILLVKNKTECAGWLYPNVMK